MKPVAPLVLVGLLGLSRGGAGYPASDHSPSPVEVAPARPATPAGTVFPSRSIQVTPVARHALSGDAISLTTRSGKLVSIPGGCASVDGAYNVTLHFHGVPKKVEAAFEHAGVPGVLVVINLGIGSGKYEKAFAREGALETMLQKVDDVVGEQCPEADHHVGRVALSAWSAGYGAVYRVLFHTDEADRVDAVLLSDGLHVGFGDKGYRQVDPLQMEPYDRFADEAVDGLKLMAITHSSIVTPKYADTTETGDYLLRSHGVAQESEDRPGPIKGMVEVSHGEKSGLSITGYAGADKKAHCHQLDSIGTTLFPRLAQRWSER
jgi:hypothetical protein